MCLAIPGKILSIERTDPLMHMGRVNLSGIVKKVNLSFVPNAEVDDYVIVHAGFAISRVDEDEAQRVFEYLDEIESMMDETDQQ